MNKNSIRSILLTTSLTVGLSMSVSTEAHAATYAAESGDSLYKISKLFDTTVANLMVVNNHTDYGLNIGEILYVPCEKYTVQKGDTLFKISEKYNISLLNLRKANNIYTNYIYVGQILEIPLPAATQSDSANIDTSEITAPAVQETADEPDSAANTEAASAVQISESVQSSEVQASALAYSDEELDLLARLIMAETEGQPYEAKVAVGSVVMNRVESGLFASSVSGVINQNINGYYQFTPVENGWINRSANEECIKAAKEALGGVDTTNGALFYYDDSTTNQWILSKAVSVKYGNMIYSY